MLTTKSVIDKIKFKTYRKWQTNRQQVKTCETLRISELPYCDILHANGLGGIAEKIKERTESSGVRAGSAISKKENTHLSGAWAERFFNVQRRTTLPQGGNFAALEVPAMLVNEMVEFFRPLRW